MFKMWKNISIFANFADNVKGVKCWAFLMANDAPTSYAMSNVALRGNTFVYVYLFICSTNPYQFFVNDQHV